MCAWLMKPKGWLSQPDLDATLCWATQVHKNGLKNRSVVSHRVVLGDCLGAHTYPHWNQRKFGHKDQCSHSFKHPNLSACGRKMACDHSCCSEKMSWRCSVSRFSEGTRLINLAVSCKGERIFPLIYFLVRIILHTFEKSIFRLYYSHLVTNF